MKKKRGGINGFFLKDKEGDDYNDAHSWDKHKFDVGGRRGQSGGTMKGTRSTTTTAMKREDEEKEGKGDGSRM